ncbi:hypothetical protein [Halohasta litorea]|uniref:Uncharacterized protein n=1 Tax=Halohasta litorea TaxID=869891 RepID=A0ABD6D5G7_9EURY|nr:hypothetical protein [Halohasta litorea]
MASQQRSVPLSRLGASGPTLDGRPTMIVIGVAVGIRLRNRVSSRLRRWMVRFADDHRLLLGGLAVVQQSWGRPVTR